MKDERYINSNFDSFFAGYKERYETLEKLLRSHKFSEEISNEYAQRFLRRLMFLYFLQKKGWLASDKDFINKIENYKELNEILFNGLNNPDNSFNLPYLNSSFFDREEYLSDEVINDLQEDMTSFFKEARTFFNRYNFTVDEFSPLEKEMSIDPYLLGTVFERMLPENERGNKGTFYTSPSEIIFIIRRAISNYLYLNGFKTADEVANNKFVDGIERYINELEKSKNSVELEEFKTKLINAVVVDPAVGSGGFLILYMNEVVNIINSAELAVIGDITSPKILKENIISNLYGFDIESEATEIARLRVWLSYVIDEDKPRPLPNLDLNIVTVCDSLEAISKMGDLSSYDETLRDKKSKYMHESDKNKKKELRQEIRNRVREIYGIKDDKEYLEYSLINKANIVIMNPPYIRQESIPKNNKERYAREYDLDKRSDIYAYFFKRAVDLLGPKGIVSVISSDKWLETGYGVSLQNYLKDKLIAVYGQRERSFRADISTVISVFSNEKLDTPVNFTYMEKYSSYDVRQNIPVARNELNPGKWFHLRAPKMFMEKIYPKLTHRLGNFAEIKFGLKTGANHFFYMKDVSSMYEADYIANPKKFEDWGVTAKNEKELKEQGLIYIENEGGERFVINKSDTVPLVRTTKELKGYTIKEMEKLCLYTKEPGDFTKKYIAWGEKQPVQIRGRKDPVSGYNNVPSVLGRKKWYSLNDLEPTNIILPMYVMDRFFIPTSGNPVICDNTLYTIKSKVKSIVSYLNSTAFYMTMELYLRRLGGGVGEIKVDDYEQMPVPDLAKLDFSGVDVSLDRNVKRYFEEVRMEDRKKLDSEILSLLGIGSFPLEEFYNEFVELVDDRLIKADRGLKSQEE
jgi:type II restriction/modification system DNA methylase subunit YeeA